MMTEEAQRTIQTLDVRVQRQIAAPIEIVFQTVLEPHGPMADMALKLEAWPGGRWYRDLGNNAGHLWGHVQVIKPPQLLEICGPMFMSYPVMSHIQYRLTKQGDGTLLEFAHQAVGLLTPEHMEGVNKGWGQMMDSIRERSQTRAERSRIV
jgi:uncharacterized protein YndB with AHSA1/START domain